MNAIDRLLACTDALERTSPGEWTAEVEAARAVEALYQAANKVLGHRDDLSPVWQVGAGQDWQHWREAKDEFRAAVRRVGGE